MAKISVIIPVYNCEDYLDETLSSVLSSSLTDIEIIIVDDGSLDASYNKCLNWANKDSRIKLIKQTNKGVVIARNNAIQIAQAEYIFPLDADDKIHPNCLEKLLTIIETNDYDVIYSQVEFFGAKTGIFKLPKAIPEEMIQRNVVVCSALYKKSDWQKYRGYDLACHKGYEDWEFWLNFFADNKKFYRVDESLFFYRIRSNSRNNIINQNDYHYIYTYIRQKHQTLYAKYYKKVKIINSINKLFKILKSPITFFLSKSQKKKWKNFKIPYRIITK
ncbi:glycosyltransferase family 2 protein [Entomomonas asaccharolytica]|uniref:Glycosyltransferase family 2 protein n=1 Tax=Entomomonas asaccharolytica TaxID=2785331 RepID=A0A974RYP0_9GAMM|nr:glycosyltransferase family 2 protein [Entomomonas asaccharolytica]QQP86104.1 glycosyltransferase family 2 protein [Entomomonas asaccharolytica]